MIKKSEAMLTDCRQTLTDYSDQQAQFKEILARQDEILADKANKHIVALLESEVQNTYQPKLSYERD